jgi:hypothetical protein
LSSIPERQAAERIGSLISQHANIPLTEHAWTEIGGKVVASRAVIRSEFDSLDVDPARLPERDVVLSQQRSNDVESVVWWEEHAHHLRREYEDALAVLERVKAGTLSQLVDRDEVAADEDDRRLSDEAAADKAVAGAPRVRAS